MSKSLILVTGPASSGKSEWAEYLATTSQKSVIYLATGKTNYKDTEWQAKISKHQQRRPKSWQTREIPVNLSAEISLCLPDSCILVDSLGTWVANCLQEDQSSWDLRVSELLQTIQDSQCDLIFVGEETGWGVVPAYEIGRLFRDRLGRLIRTLGTQADQVYLVTGGYALNLTVLGQKLPREL
jgi:adenosylcobinamide kinase/adenosylcobinamide-phosphate guanylyltransferase